MEIINWLNQNSGFLLVLLTLAYVISTVVTVWKMKKANDLAKESIDVFTELEKDRNRPSLFFTIEPVKSFIIQAKIKNIGSTTAQNVSIKTNPEIRNLRNNKKIKFIADGIPSLPPGAEFSTIVGTFEEFKEEYNSDDVIGYIEYERLDGKIYKEDFDIDLSVYEGLQFIREKGIHEIAKTLDKIRKDLHHLTTGFKNPLIRTIDEKKHKEEQDKRDQEAEKQLKQMAKEQNIDKSQEE